MIKFITYKDVMQMYGISKATALRRIKEAKSYYNQTHDEEFDDNRVPRKGAVPLSLVDDYFNQGKKKRRCSNL